MNSVEESLNFLFELLNNKNTSEQVRLITASYILDKTQEHQ